jgi:hypothetical protein
LTFKLPLFFPDTAKKSGFCKNNTPFDRIWQGNLLPDMEFRLAKDQKYKPKIWEKMAGKAYFLRIY